MINSSDIDVKLNNPELRKLTKKGANIIIYYKDKKLKVPKILNGHRKHNQKTKTELKKSKLMPAAPPVGYGLQQFNGEIFFIYDMDKTKPYSSSEEERKQQRIYRKDLIERKRCPLCGKIQKTLNYLSHIYINEKYTKCCIYCEDEYYKKIDEQNQKKKDLMYANFRAMDKSKIICIDAETTGVDIWNDEILQLSIIDGNGKVLFNQYFKPEHHVIWEKAESINHISPQMVADKKPLILCKEEIEAIINNADLLVGYNLLQFDLPLLEHMGISISNKMKYDVMLEFAEIYGEYNEHYGNYKWQKLITCAEYYNYPGGNFHDSLEDVKATLFCFFKMIN